MLFKIIYFLHIKNLDYLILSIRYVYKYLAQYTILFLFRRTFECVTKTYISINIMSASENVLNLENNVYTNR